MHNMKFCKDCKYEKRDYMSYVPIIGQPFRKFSKCGHPNFIKIDRITGQYSYNSFCSVLRIFECGEQAKYFEPKNND